MKISSPAFSQGQPIPKKYSCQGADLSPPLHLEGLPDNAKTLALIMDDPDAPSGTFDHWIAWNIDPISEIEENTQFSHLGKNHFGKNAYGGPCPPPGKAHRYFFKLYALDIQLGLATGSSKNDLLEAMKGHVLEKAELMGTYQRE